MHGMPPPSSLPSGEAMHVTDTAAPSLGARAPAARFGVLPSSIVAALGGLLFGFDTAVISGTTAVLPRVFALDAGGVQLGFTVASALLGTIVGALLGGAPSERFGRRKVLYAVAALFFLSALGCSLAPVWSVLVACRFLGGIAVGAASVVSPLYIAEIAPARLRGRLVAISQANVVSGILLAYVSNWAVFTICGSSDSAWRWMLAVQMVPAAAFFVLLSFIPESPRWLVGRGRDDEARRVLTGLGAADAEQELERIRASLRGAVVGRRERLFQRAHSLPIIATILVATFNQVSGINALIYYAGDIFALAGADRGSALFQSMLLGGTNLVFTLLAMTCIDRFGRRPLLIVGGLGTALCLAGVAWTFYHHPPGSPATGQDGALVLACLLGYIACFAFSQGAVIWVFISEIFPNRVRTQGQALGSLVHWVWAAAISWIFPVIASASGGHAFAFFAAMMLLQAFLAWRYMPETKGTSLEGIQQNLGIH